MAQLFGECVDNPTIMLLDNKLRLPVLTTNLNVDVRALFGLPPEKAAPRAKSQPSVAELTQERVQAEFAKLSTLNGSALEQARRNFIDSLQVYNTATGAHQAFKIAGLDSPFISTPELIRQSSVIQTAMQRDVILNARDHAQQLAKDAEELWGMSAQNDHELHSHFEALAQQLSGALAQFDVGNADGAVATYRRAMSDGGAYLAWMARDLRQSEQLKHGAEVGITAAAGVAAVVATDGVALTLLGFDGLAALSGGARLGLLVGNGAVFTAAHRALEEKILHIPFWRKDSVVGNAIDLAIDMGRTAALMGTLKVMGEGAALALPIAKTEPALMALRNFGAELSGFNGFDIATGVNPREIFTLHHQLNQLSFLLGLRVANGAISGIPSMMKGVAVFYNRMTKSPTLNRLAYLSLAMLGVTGIPAPGSGKASARPTDRTLLLLLKRHNPEFAGELERLKSEGLDVNQRRAAMHAMRIIATVLPAADQPGFIARLEYDPSLHDHEVFLQSGPEALLEVLNRDPLRQKIFRDSLREANYELCFQLSLLAAIPWFDVAEARPYLEDIVPTMIRYSEDATKDIAERVAIFDGTIQQYGFQETARLSRVANLVAEAADSPDDMDSAQRLYLDEYPGKLDGPSNFVIAKWGELKSKIPRFPTDALPPLSSIQRLIDLEIEYLGDGQPSRDGIEKLGRLAIDSPHRQHPRRGALIESEAYGALYSCMLAAYDQGAAFYRQFIDGLKTNVQEMAMMVRLGINVDVWKAGIPARQVMVDVKNLSQSTEDATFLGAQFSILQQGYSDLTDTLRSPQRLFQKLKEASGYPKKWNPDQAAENFVAILNHLQSQQDLKRLKTVLNTTFEFLNRADHVRPGPTLNLAKHHITRVRDMLNASPKKMDDTVLVAVGPPTKDPVKDLTIGNESGCCIGVYVGDDVHTMSNGIYMPFYLKDLATQLLPIVVGKDRVGLALLFAAESGDGEPVLIVNSIELGRRMDHQPTAFVDRVVRETLMYISDYAIAAGFKYVTVSDHGYNTGFNHGKRFLSNSPAPTQVIKIHAGDPFYSDLFKYETNVVAVGDDMRVLRINTTLSGDPETHLVTPQLKTFSADSLRQNAGQAEISQLMIHHNLAFRLLEDKPVTVEYVRAFGEALNRHFQRHPDRLDFCVRMVQLPWDEAKPQLDSLIAH